MCSECLDLFASIGELFQHQKKMGHAKKSHECDICGKLLTSQRYLDKHKLRLHKNNKNIFNNNEIGNELQRCEYCFKPFYDILTKTRHMETIHKNIVAATKKLICVKCFKPFAKLNELFFFCEILPFFQR